MGLSALRDASQLVCVAPESVSDLWPAVSPLIRAAIDRTGLSLFSNIEADALAGKSLVWLAWSGAEIEAAAVTQLQMTDAGKVCVIVACGGTDRGRWLPLLEQIESHAAQEGCELTRIFGRRGWLRVLEGYSVSNVVLDKPTRESRPRGLGNRRKSVDAVRECHNSDLD